LARAKLSSLLQALEGRFGGGVFRNWKGLTVLSALQDSVRNPNTVNQVKFREILTVASKAWTNLSAAKRAGWEAVAEYLTRQREHFSNEAGTRTVIRVPRGPYTALGSLTATLGLLGSVDRWDSGDAIPDPPAGATGPSQPTAVSVTGDTDDMVVTWVDPASMGDLATTQYTRIWVMSEDGHYFPQLASYKADGVQTATITTLRQSGSGVAGALEPGWYHIQLDSVNDLGLRGAPSAVFSIRLALPA